ncbi:protein-disulfide reductase DsbD domain-containing protein, partial [Aestuariivirga sp.]|uniref:protein-disulfide reductase DsbD domain-containing protein n=1 Tax=Aestuariivirga sp. TaxID=2650926 RepID=UPI0035B2ED28
MWNRLAAAALMLTFAIPAMAAEKPYRVSLVGDGFDGTSWHTGVLIELAPGWKTYWRMPGDSGIPPEFTWSPSQPARVEVQFPTPSRHVDKGG